MHIYTVTTLASICQYCYHFSKCMSRLTTLASICQYWYHTGKYMSLLLPHWRVSVYTVTTLASICQQCYHIDKYISVALPHRQSIYQYCYQITFSKCMSILLPHWQAFVSTVTTLATACVYLPHWQVYVSSQYCYHTGTYLSVL